VHLIDYDHGLANRFPTLEGHDYSLGVDDAAAVLLGKPQQPIRKET
jgi:hypothetical protein